MARIKSNISGNTATIGFEAKLWLTADAKRGFRDRCRPTNAVLATGLTSMENKA